MPISSFPMSVRSSINLSDINIDSNLDMGTNSIIGYIAGDINQLYRYFTYGYSYFTITPIEIWNDATEYSQNNSNTPLSCFSKTLNSSLNENIINGYKYIVKHDFQFKADGLTTARGEARFSNDLDNKVKITCGGGTWRNASIRTILLDYGTTLTHQIMNSHTNPLYTVYSKNHIGYLIGKQPVTPLTSSNFELDKIVSIILPNASDKVIFNNDSLKTITGVKQVFIQNGNISLLSDEYNSTEITYTGEGGGGGNELYQIYKQRCDITIPTITRLDITGNPIIILKN